MVSPNNEEPFSALSQQHPKSTTSNKTQKIVFYNKAPNHTQSTSNKKGNISSGESGGVRKSILKLLKPAQSLIMTPSNQSSVPKTDNSYQ